MPGGLLGAISGILAGGILGFGAAEWIVLLDTFARSCFLIWCFVFVSVQDLVIQRHHQPPHWSCLVRARFSGFVVWLVLLALVFAFVVFWFPLWFGPDLTSDCVMVPTPLSTPQSGTLQLHLRNSFISTTMCDDLARATEAQDGKKKRL